MNKQKKMKKICFAKYEIRKNTSKIQERIKWKMKIKRKAPYCILKTGGSFNERDNKS